MVERTFAQIMAEDFGYQCISTFWQDFRIADRFGVAAIKDTYRRATREWKNNVKMYTELVLVLNHSCWEYYEKNNTLSQLYSDLYYKAYDEGFKLFNGEELSYYVSTLD